MSARKYANAEACRGLLPPRRLEILHRKFRRLLSPPKAAIGMSSGGRAGGTKFSSAAISARKQGSSRSKTSWCWRIRGRNPSVAVPAVDFGDKEMVREMTERRKPIGHSRRLSARHDQMTRRGQPAVAQGMCQFVGEHCAHAVAEEGEPPFEMRREVRH